METILLQINNSKAYRLLEDLEALHIVKVLKRINKTVDKERPSAHDFLGLTSKEYADLMEKAIEQRCEQVNPDD